MAHYNSYPTAPLSRDDAVRIIVTGEKYGLWEYEAEDLLTRAQASDSGMACFTRDNLRDIWVTCMKTIPGKFIIELG
jgi:hypothetical protein